MTTNLLLVALFVFCMIVMSLNYNRRKKKVLFFGNGLTDMDKRPGGFLSWMVQYISNEGLDNKYEVMQSIKDGEKITDLTFRLDNDVLLKDVQVVIINIGLYDLLDIYTKGAGTDLERFVELYEAMLLKIKEADIKPIICLPTMVMVHGTTHEMQQQMETYRNSIFVLADKYLVPTVDVAQVFAPAFVANNPGNEPYDLHKAIGVKMWSVLKDVKFK